MSQMFVAGRRLHPQERFAADEDVIDLHDAAAQLEAEDQTVTNGHRQITLFKHGPATVALFTFEAGAKLADHVVDGPVILQTLSGRVTVNGESGSHPLPAGRLLRLASGVRHDVHADEASRVLLTVFLEGPESHR